MKRLNSEDEWLSRNVGQFPVGQIVRFEPTHTLAVQGPAEAGRNIVDEAILEIFEIHIAVVGCFIRLRRSQVRLSRVHGYAFDAEVEIFDSRFEIGLLTVHLEDGAGLPEHLGAKELELPCVELGRLEVFDEATVSNGHPIKDILQQAAGALVSPLGRDGIEEGVGLCRIDEQFEKVRHYLHGVRFGGISPPNGPTIQWTIGQTHRASQPIEML
jgi:hypothetical protein